MRIGPFLSVLLGLGGPLHAEDVQQQPTYYYPQVPYYAPYAPYGYQAPTTVVAPQPAPAATAVSPAPREEASVEEASQPAPPPPDQAAAVVAADVPAGSNLRVESGRLGPVLADAEGRTLYFSNLDGSGGDGCDPGCQPLWTPALLGDGPSPAEPYGALRRADGSLQWTYQGRPLYRWIGDEQAGDVTGDGVDGTWFAVRMGRS